MALVKSVANSHAGAIGSQFIHQMALVKNAAMQVQLVRNSSTRGWNFTDENETYKGPWP
jgi:hypothetical protein